MGQWPYQSPRTKYIILVAIALFAGTQVIAKICATLTYFDDIEILLESLAPLFTDIMAAIKLANSVVKTKEMKRLINRIRVDFASCSTDDELKILKQYAEDGRRFTIMYGGFLYSIMIIFMIAPMKPLILNTINGTDERPFVHHTEYFVDPQNYYYPIIVHSYVTVLVCVTTVVTMDTMFMILVQHACGLFSALGHQLRYLVEDENLMIEVNPSISNDKPFKKLTMCVYKHKKAIEFADLIESYYSTCFLAQAGITVIGMSASGLQAVTYVNETAKFLQQLLFSYAHLLHLFFECVNGQRLINHSERMYEYLLNLKWYQTSFRTRKVVSIMLIRSQLPCVLTAASMFDISMETFSTLYATLSSYNDINVVMEDMASLMSDTAGVIKLVNSALTTKEMRELLARVQLDYASLATDDELKIMQEFAENGRKMTIMYSGVFFVLMMLFMIPPLKPMFFNNLNGTNERVFIHHTEYFVDPLDYFYPIMLHSYITIFIVVCSIVAMDTMFVVLVQHACGLFTTLGYRLCHITENDTLLIDINPSRRNDKSFENISLCVHKHQEAIEFVELIQSYYSTSFFLHVGLNVMGLSITGEIKIEIK
ncbi:hypothetical protein KPH14_001749 [Odynerus spinipes]|uniref:Odorant receptor n=1 Tax=Odynerus spinipes TaxID=1348599 RepID=A0AAD9VVU2_9HYME|nr:hypothetical protein KPH14_001749 [Odynerus spinipes]